MSGEATPSMREAVDQATSRRMRKQLRTRWASFLVGASVTLGLDQLTKVIVRATIEPGETIGVFPGFQLVRARNEGIAFGFFPGNRGVIAVLTVVAMVVIAWALLRFARSSLLVAVGGGLLIGGSVGNLIDRLAHGGVTDFFDPVSWPAFNVADIGIVVGAGLAALGLLRAGGTE